MWRTLLLWFGLTTATTAFVAWLASLCVLSYRASSSGKELTVALWHGELWVTTGRSYMLPGFSITHRGWPPGQAFTGLRWWPQSGWVERIAPGATAGIFGTSNWWVLTVPLWVPTAFGIGLSVWVFPAWRRRRMRDGHCQRCGYDIRGLNSVCPECGKLLNPLPIPSPH